MIYSCKSVIGHTTKGGADDSTLDAVAGSVLKDIRVNAGDNQTTTCVLMGMNQSSYSSLELGTRRIRLGEFYLICEIYGHSPTTIMAFIESKMIAKKLFD